MLEVGVDLNPKIIDGLLQKASEVERETAGFNKLISFLDAIKECDYPQNLVDKIPSKVDECAQNIGQSHSGGIEGYTGARC